VAYSVLFVLSLTFAWFSGTVRDIQGAFIANDANVLYRHFSSAASLNISLPEPFSFSDQLSSQQALFLFKQFFSTHRTLEFDPDVRLSSLRGKKGAILKARWSFKNARDGGQYAFRVFFYIVPESEKPRGSPARPPGFAGSAGKQSWRILEIKAENY